MLEVFVADIVTGRRIVPIPYATVELEVRRNSPDAIRAKISLIDKAHRLLNLRSNAPVGKTLLAVFEGDFCLAAGEIISRDYDDDSRQLTLEIQGIWSLLDNRFVLPQAAQSTPLLVQSGPTAGEPNPATRTFFSQKSWPAIVRGLIQQSMALPGGALPIVFGPDGVGAHDKTYQGSAFKSIGGALTDLTNLDDGPEIQFIPRMTSDRKGLEFLVRVGDDQKRELSSPTVHRFDFSVEKRSVSGLRVRDSAEGMTSEAWAIGGRESAEALISVARSSALTNAGYPRRETVSSAHSTVVWQSTLDSYAREDLALGQRPTEFWTFSAQMDQPPYIGTYTLGDYCDIVIKDNAFGIPDGVHRRRIAALSVSSRNRKVAITTDEVFG